MDDFDPTNPENLNLTPRIERGAVPTRYLFRYDLAQMVECAFCPNHTDHKHGFVVEMDDGRIARCGNCCARRFFGDEVATRLDADLRRREHRIEMETFLAPVLAGIDGAVLSVDRWISVERGIDMSVSGLIIATSRIDLRRQVSPGGTIDRTRRDFVEAEETGMDGRMRKVRHPRETVIGRVRGASVLFGNGGPLARAITKLRTIQEKGRCDTTKLSDQLLAHLMKVRSDAVKAIEEGAARIAAAQIFFTRDNIEQLGLWCQERDAEVQIRFINPITGPAVHIRARAFDGPVSVPTPTIDEVPVVEDLIGSLQRKAA